MSLRDRILPWAECTTLDGRANRLNFFVLSVLYSILTFLFSVMAFLVLHYFSMFYLFSKTKYMYIYIIVFGLYFALLFFASIALMVCVTVKRLHDLGLPSLVALAIYMPIPVGLIGLMLELTHMMPAWLKTGFEAFQDSMQMLNAAVYVYLCLAPGERGANKYGPDSTVPRDVLALEPLDVVNPK